MNEKLTGLRQALNSRYFLWTLLAAPSIPILLALAAGGRRATHNAVHETGEFAAYFMLISLLLSPLLLLFPRLSLLRWLLERRRYFGVAAFSYAAAHLILYLVDLDSLRQALGEFLTLGLGAGWVAIFLFIPLAVTSNGFSVRLLGARRWKSLHRLAYVAAVAVLLHWVFVENEPVPALIYFLPLALLEAYRFWHILSRRRMSVSA